MRQFFGFLGSCLLCFLYLAGSPSRGEALTLEVAPRDLRALSSADDLLITASGQEVILFDAASLEVHRFLESGSSWGKAKKLSAQEQPAPRFSRLDASGGTLSFSGHRGVFLYTDKGVPKGQMDIFQPGDIAQISTREWAVSLTNLPHPAKPGAFIGRRQFGKEIPRVIVLDRNLEVTEKGMIVEDSLLSGSAAVGQTLRLAWSGQHLYAAELASYRIYQLDRDLETQTIFNDPELAFKEQEHIEATPEEDEAMAEAQQDLGADASRPKKAGPKAKGKRLTARYTPVIRDITWDDSGKRLLILIDAAALAERPAVDLLDPSTGESRRVELRLPKGAKPVTLTQIATTRRFVWLRGYAGTSPTFRFAKADFEALADEPSVVPEIIRSEIQDSE